MSGPNKGDVAGQRRRYRARYPDRRRADRARYRAENLARVAALKLEAGCVDCGYHAHPAALDYDHVRGKKLASVRALAAAGVAWARVAAEIAKCEVRCANCHRIRTVERRLALAV